MAHIKTKGWIFFYLMVSSFVFSVLGEVQLSESEADEISRSYIADFEKQLDTAIANAPDDPDNDLDSEDRPRFFFLFALLPKLLLLLAKVAIKAVPIIIKAAAVVKAKVIATAAATAAKFATGAAIKQTVIAGVTKLAKVAVETIVVDAITDKITDAIVGKPEPEEKPVVQEAEKPKISSNIFDYYDYDEICECTSKRKCGCCVTPPNQQTGCLNITLQKPLWDIDGKIKVGTFYGGKNVMTRTLPVKRPRQKCLELAKPFNTTKMCVSTHGRTTVGKRIIQCISVHFNQRGLTKCLVQNQNNKVWFKTDV